MKLVNSTENNTIRYATITGSGLSFGTAVVNFSTCASGMETIPTSLNIAIYPMQLETDLLIGF